jgi:ArsR family transcriptional regulator
MSMVDIESPCICQSEYIEIQSYLSRRILESVKRTPKSFDLSGLFAALADRTRLRLLNLMNGREVCVCYFVEILNQSQPKVSRHLAYLRRAGIVRARREAKWMHYTIERPADAGAAAILDATLGSFGTDREMQADLTQLGKACCQPERFVALQGAPVPVRLQVENTPPPALQNEKGLFRAGL